MARVLVTYGWCRTAYLAVRSLSAQGHEVYSCSHLLPSMSAWSRFCHAAEGVSNPTDTPKLFGQQVGALVERWGIEIVMPGHEDALALREWLHLLPSGVQVACPELELLRIGVNKANITRLAQKVGVPVPKTVFPSSLEEALDIAPALGFPLVVKIAHSNSAKGVAVVRSLDELRTVLTERFASAVEASGDQFPYLQAFHEGTVVGGCFMARHGCIDAHFGERYLRVKSSSMGTSVFREPYASTELQSRMVDLVRALDWNGIGHFDFIEDLDTGRLVLLEMNPRPWGAINLAYVNGFDFVGAAVAYALGERNLTRFFRVKPARALRSMWIIGEGIRWTNLLATRQFSAAIRAPFEVIGSLRNSRFDDFVWHDPMPLFAEAICYGKGFLSSGGEFNPG